MRFLPLLLLSICSCSGSSRPLPLDGDPAADAGSAVYALAEGVRLDLDDWHDDGDAAVDAGADSGDAGVNPGLDAGDPCPDSYANVCGGCGCIYGDGFQDCTPAGVLVGTRCDLDAVGDGTWVCDGPNSVVCAP